MRRRLRLFATAGLAGLVLATLAPLAANVAFAKSCSGSYCIYEPNGSSGSNARGTGSLIQIPTSVTLYKTDELIAGTVFLYSSSSTALETGAGIGDDIVCGYNPYWTPYATKNNGSTEKNDCGYHLGANTTWQI